MTRSLGPYADMMTRRDFERIAQTLGAIANDAERTTQTALWVATLLESNPRFDRAKFAAAVERVAAQRRTRRAAERWRTRSRRCARCGTRLRTRAA